MSRRLTTWRGISLQSPGATETPSLKVLSDTASQCFALFDVNQKPCNLQRAASTGGLTCPLPDDLARALVFPQPEKHRVPQPIIPGPFREFHLANHCRFDPMATFHFGGG
jgi:hypothetical protein